jgi:hypothetical protein
MKCGALNIILWDSRWLFKYWIVWNRFYRSSVTYPEIWRCEQTFRGRRCIFKLRDVTLLFCRYSKFNQIETRCRKWLTELIYSRNNLNKRYFNCWISFLYGHPMVESVPVPNQPRNPLVSKALIIDVRELRVWKTYLEFRKINYVQPRCYKNDWRTIE